MSVDRATKQHISDRLRRDAKYVEGRRGHEERRALMREAADYIDQLEQDIAQLTSPDEVDERAALHELQREAQSLLCAAEPDLHQPLNEHGHWVQCECETCKPVL